MIVIAHRGASGTVTENTLPAFEHAIGLGADMVEMDVRFCASGEIVVFHDDTLTRLTRGEHNAYIADLPLASLRGILLDDIYTISTLEEVIQAIGLRTTLCIELKEEGMAEALAALLGRMITEGTTTLDNLYIISFWHTELAKLREFMPSIQIGVTLCGLPADYAACASLIQANTIHPCIHFTNQALVEDAHARGIKVMVWTADSEHDITKAEALGVDGITSNYPERLLARRGSGGQEEVG